MKVILLENVRGVGKKDDIINANDGYARNYLFPKKLAIEADSKNLAKLQSKKDSNTFKRNVEKQEAEKIKDKLSKVVVNIKVKAGGNGKIFGGVTSKEIASELKKQINIDIDKKKIDLKETIKTLGEFNIDVKLFEGVIGKIKVNIISC